ncbi:hypothetical protein Tco_1393407 [Tanacetum coccineum]
MVLGPENDRASCDELDAQPSPPDEGVMTFLRKKVKTRAVIGKRVLLQVIKLNFEGWKLDGYQADGRSCVVLKMVLVGQETDIQEKEKKKAKNKKTEHGMEKTKSNRSKTGRLNMLFRDRRAHAYTRHQMDTEARLSREAWRRSMDASDLARREVMSLRTIVLGQMSMIRELHAAYRRRQAVISEMLKADHRRSAEMRELRTADHTRQQQLIQTLTVMQSLQGQVTTLQGQVAALQGQVTALQGQQGPAGGPAQPELPEEAGSSS